MKTLTWSDITTLTTKDAGGRWQVNPGSIAEKYMAFIKSQREPIRIATHECLELHASLHTLRDMTSLWHEASA